MKRIVLVFGLISGLISVVMLVVMLPLTMNGTVDMEHSEIIGYTTMFLSFLLIFFGIRSYRENVGGGTITFGRAFKVGILITLIACAVYVTSWEIYYFNFDSGFADKYADLTIQKMRDRGASASEIAAEQKKMEEFKRLYANPFFNIGVTFMEMFPVGLIMTLVSAGILRKKSPDALVTATAAA